MPTVDSATVTLDHGGTDSLTLNWSTSTDDKGDWTATANDPVGGSDSTSVLVVETHTRTTTAVSPGGDAVVTRVLDGARSTLASGAGDASITRTVDASRSTSASGSGAASVTRALDAVRTTAAVSPGGDATITRTATSTRTTIARSPGGDAVVVWTAPTAWSLPTSTARERTVLVTPTTVDSDHDQLSLSAEVAVLKVDALDFYQPGDVDKQEGAFGTFRRIPRDGHDPIQIDAPDEFSPPFDDRRVVPEGFSANEVAPRRYELQLDLGLEEPRPREPLRRDAASELVDSLTSTVEAGATESVTLTWTPDGSEIGDWLATVTSPDASAEELVTVSDSPWTLAFPIATLGLTRGQVHPIERSVESGVAGVALELRVDAQQMATIFAAGSRVEAVQVRSVPDAGNIVVDTLPNEELTCTLAAPADSDVESGTYIVSSWSMTRGGDGRLPYDVDLELLSA
jgi:hypothetical protein